VRTVRHVARAIGATGSAVPAYRVDVRVGTHQVTADEPVAAGGGDIGPSPLGLLLSGLAACTATTLRMYTARKGWELTTIEVDVRYYIDDDGRRFIDRKISVPAGLTLEQRQRLAEIAERTPVTIAVRDGTPITTIFLPGDA